MRGAIMAGNSRSGEAPRRTRARCGDATTREPNPTVETRIWLPEFEWLCAVAHSSANCAPVFRMPDLVSACVAIVRAQQDGAALVFQHLGMATATRDPLTERRMAMLWRPQFEWLHELQLSPANRYPNPRFQLDQLTTACVAIVKALDQHGAQVIKQARENVKERTRQDG